MPKPQCQRDGYPWCCSLSSTEFAMCDGRRDEGSKRSWWRLRKGRLDPTRGPAPAIHGRRSSRLLRSAASAQLGRCGPLFWRPAIGCRLGGEHTGCILGSKPEGGKRTPDPAPAIPSRTQAPAAHSVSGFMLLSKRQYQHCPSAPLPTRARTRTKRRWQFEYRSGTPSVHTVQV